MRIHIQCRNYWEAGSDGTPVALAAAELCFLEMTVEKKSLMDTTEDRAVNAAIAWIVYIGN